MKTRLCEMCNVRQAALYDAGQDKYICKQCVVGMIESRRSLTEQDYKDLNELREYNAD